MDASEPIFPIGRGAASNPVNRFLPILAEADYEHLEFDEDLAAELQRPVTRYYDDTSKSIVSENESPDIPFRSSLNPYRGCLHGCSYCYVMLRLPLAVETIFVEWLKRHRPSVADKIESRLRAIRGGKLSESGFGVRMRGLGPIADQISALFKLNRNRCGLGDTLPESRTDLFRPPATSGGQMHLF